MGYFIYLPKIGWFRIFLSREIPKDAEIGKVIVLGKADRKIARVRHDFLHKKISTTEIINSAWSTFIKMLEYMDRYF